eukprot:TRINITY_DN12368_c0_g4_i1.p1 TRINITY_DN12368_c0_g4~~TRINITY_DN12368_c0_g4_i1.p1  ORF type:complete len:171 (-),score=3.72 TRINITY_DN12368_c0_g4_i1:1984-2496(-)
MIDTSTYWTIHTNIGRYFNQNKSKYRFQRGMDGKDAILVARGIDEYGENKGWQEIICRLEIEDKSIAQQRVPKRLQLKSMTSDMDSWIKILADTGTYRPIRTGIDHYRSDILQGIGHGLRRPNNRRNICQYRLVGLIYRLVFSKYWPMKAACCRKRKKKSILERDQIGRG